MVECAIVCVISVVILLKVNVVVIGVWVAGYLFERPCSMLKNVSISAIEWIGITIEIKYLVFTNAKVKVVPCILILCQFRIVVSRSMS